MRRGGRWSALGAVRPGTDGQPSRPDERQQRAARGGQQCRRRADGRRRRGRQRDGPRLLLHLACRQQRAEAEGYLHRRRQARRARAATRRRARIAEADPLQSLERHARRWLRGLRGAARRQSPVDPDPRPGRPPQSPQADGGRQSDCLVREPELRGSGVSDQGTLRAVGRHHEPVGRTGRPALPIPVRVRLDRRMR